MSESRQNENRGYENGWSSQQWGPMSAMMAPWMPMMRMWQESMSAFTQGTPMASMTEWMNAFTPGAGFGRPGSVCVAVQLSSQTPATVRVELDGGAETMKLSAAPLQHASSRTAPSLVGVRFDTQNGAPRVSVTIPSDQPGGTYRGQVQDDTGVRRGQLTVEVQASTPATAGAAKKTRTRTRKKA
jgi:hypothetical protein